MCIRDRKEIGNTNTIDQSIAKFGGANGIPAVNTDWYDEILRVAPVSYTHLCLI